MKRKAAKSRILKSQLRPVACGFLAALGIAMPPAESYAEMGAQIETAPPGATLQISMAVGKSEIVPLPRDASEIFVGNPKVANAVVRSARKLYIIGMQEGQTTIFALDAAGHQFARLEISIGADVGNLEQILKEALPTSSITTSTVGNAIILRGLVDSAEDAQRAMDITQAFVKPTDALVTQGTGGAGEEGNGTASQRSANYAGQISGSRETLSQVRHDQIINSLVIRGRDQVMLKVSVAEIQRDIAKQLGLTSSTWGAFTQYNPFGINGVIAANPATGAPTQLVLHNPSNTVNATLEAFERYGVSRILAEPTVTAISGENARFTVGGEIPIPGVQSCVATTSCPPAVVFQPYGVTLNFSPVVLSGGRILLHIATEVTELDYQTSMTIQNVAVPGLSTRKNETTVEVPSGGSIASAGFLQTTSTQVVNGLPGLMNLPILGTLFRSRDYQRNETELMIIVTPYLMKATATNLLPKPDDGFADSSDPQAWLLGRINRLYASPNNPEALKNFNGRVGFIQD
ncbi:MAG: type II and III secretion system protein family protein [Methylovirgula sp.]